MTVFKDVNLICIEICLLGWIYADVVTEAVVVFHVFVDGDFDELIL